MARFGKALAVGADVTRAVGPRAAARILHQDVRRRRQGSGPRDRVYERLWGRAAEVLGAGVTRHGALIEITRSGARTWVEHQATDLDGSVTVRVVRDKALSLRTLREAGVPVPESKQVAAGDLHAAVAFLEQCGVVAVKPASDTGGGFGVSAGIRSRDDLARALRRAGRTQRRVVLERHITGDVYRVLLLDGRVLDVLRRRSPRVRGDGARSVLDLILAENEKRLASFGAAGIDLLRVDLDCLTTLGDLGVRTEDVPRAGEWQTVKAVTNQNSMADNDSIDGLHASIIAECTAAARSLGVRLAGVDVITNRTDVPLAESGGAILEVNAHPGLHHHTHVSHPSDGTNVTVPVLQALLERTTHRSPGSPR